MMVLHGLSAEKEKSILVAIVGVLILAVLVWFSADFPAQGQAYRYSLEIEQFENLNRDLLTYCQDPFTCQFVDSVAQVYPELYLDGNVVSAYELTYFDANGKEVVVISEIDVKEYGFIESLDAVDVMTVGFQGKRFPVDSLSTTVLS